MQYNNCANKTENLNIGGACDNGGACCNIGGACCEWLGLAALMNCLHVEKHRYHEHNHDRGQWVCILQFVSC